MPSLGGSGQYGGDDVSGGADRNSQSDKQNEDSRNNTSAAYQQAAQSMIDAGVQNLSGMGTQANRDARAAAGDTQFSGRSYGALDFFGDIGETILSSMTGGFLDTELTGKSFGLRGVQNAEIGSQLDPVRGIATAIGGPLAGKVADFISENAFTDMNLDFDGLLANLGEGSVSRSADSSDFPGQGSRARQNDDRDQPTQAQVPPETTAQTATADASNSFEDLFMSLLGDNEFAFLDLPAFTLLDADDVPAKLGKKKSGAV